MRAGVIFAKISSGRPASQRHIQMNKSIDARWQCRVLEAEDNQLTHGRAHRSLNSTNPPRSSDARNEAIGQDRIPRTIQAWASGVLAQTEID